MKLELDLRDIADSIIQFQGAKHSRMSKPQLVQWLYMVDENCSYLDWIPSLDDIDNMLFSTYVYDNRLALLKDQLTSEKLLALYEEREDKNLTLEKWVETLDLEEFLQYHLNAGEDACWVLEIKNQLPEDNKIILTFDA